METATLTGLDFSPEINLARYLQKIRRYPILSQEEEYALSAEYVRSKSDEVAFKLITSHLRLVVTVVAKYRGYGLPMNELISEGNIGLLYALDKFDPEKGFRFSTYALWWIKASVQKYILNSWSLVKLGTTAAQKKLFFNLRKIKNQLGLIDDRDLSDPLLSEIADTLDVSVQDVKEMNNRLQAHDGSLNAVIDSESDSAGEWLDFISDSKPNQEETLAYRETVNYRRKLFKHAVLLLNDRERDILYKRRMAENATTLEDLSQFYHISKERVRQIELNSIRKISKAVEVIN